MNSSRTREPEHYAGLAPSCLLGGPEITLGGSDNPFRTDGAAEVVQDMTFVKFKIQVCTSGLKLRRTGDWGDDEGVLGVEINWELRNASDSRLDGGFAQIPAGGHDEIELPRYQSCLDHFYYVKATFRSTNDPQHPSTGLARSIRTQSSAPTEFEVVYTLRDIPEVAIPNNSPKLHFSAGYIDMICNITIF